MSSLTTWLSIGALVVVALFAVNALVYRARTGTFLRRERVPLSRKHEITKTGVVIYGLMTAALGAGVTVPVLAPESTFAHWLLEPFSLVVYSIWCLLLTTLLGVVLTLLGFPIAKQK